LTPLEVALLERVRRDGPMTFRDFMAQALYHPEHGYYTTGRPWEGAGDFTTAPRYGEVFALAIARFAARVRDAMGPGAFELCEVGAGSGLLSAQLAKLLADVPIRVRAVETRRPSLLPSGVPWSASLRGLSVRGAIVSNELFDALPVHRVTRTREGLREVWVGERGGRLGPLVREPSRPELAAYLDRFGMVLEDGQTVEVGLDALAMLREMGAALEQGVVLTIDYGMEARELLHHRKSGTLAATRAHRLAPDALADPGFQDLTTHVNLTALRAEGEAIGLRTVTELPQWAFLAATGALEVLGGHLQNPARWEEGLAAKTLVAPGRMGDFRVLVQCKGLDAAAAQRLQRGLAGP
jgi:SAM-dependent MidA family methyltransferase